MKKTKFDVLKLGSFLLLAMLLSACSSAKTSTLPSSALQPVAMQGTKAEVVNLAFETARQSFPDEQQESDERAGVFKIIRGSLFSGRTLIIIRCEQQKEDNWLVHVESAGTGLNQPLGNRSNAEVTFYLNALKNRYNLYAARRDALKKEKELASLSEAKRVAPAQSASPAIPKAETEAPKTAPAAAVTATATEPPKTPATTEVKEAPPAATQKIKVIGNSDSKRYHLPGMKYYNAVASYHRVEFDSEADAIKAGYRRGAGKPSVVAAQAATESAAVAQKAEKIKVIGNSDSKRYHLLGMKYYNAVEAYHRVEFDSEDEAIKAGYHKARK